MPTESSETARKRAVVLGAQARLDAYGQPVRTEYSRATKHTEQYSSPQEGEQRFEVRGMPKYLNMQALSVKKAQSRQASAENQGSSG